MVEKRNIRRKSQMARRSLSMMMAVVFFCACARQFEELDVVDVPQGEPARVSLTFTVPEMPAVTRAAGIDPESSDARTLQDLWIGFYDSVTGNRVADPYYTPLNVSLSYHQRKKIDNIPTVSGKCIIVAVANVGINSGLVAGKDQKPTLLLDLLKSDAASTFGGFQQIAMVMGSPDAVVRASPSLVMCGTYSRDRSVDDEPNSLAGGNPHGNDDDLTPVDIYPGNNTLAGAIHLRRLDSYITFNLIPAENVTVTPLSWQVCNLPGIGYVFDQKGKNAADLAAAPGTEIWTQWSSGDSTSGDNAEANAALNASYYHNSQIFGSNMFSRLTTGGFSFDFFQMENKHTGLLESTLESNDVSGWYPHREREYKTDEDGLNTGWYKSLVSETDYQAVANTLATPSAESGLSNNNASFVVIRARVEYYYKIDGNGTPNYQPVDPPADPNESGYVRRVGNALYTIHLGYCDGKDGSGNPTLATANDFNCFRNTKYTYTVYINGVDNIRVEAVRDPEGTEPQSGAEGTVTDLVSTLITLDSHYGVFNLGLTDKQREALFWRIQSPFDNQVIDLVGYSGETNLFVGSNLIDVTNNPDIRAALPKNQFYNWIQIRPTTDAETVAEYPGDPRLIGRRIRNIDNQADDENIIYPLNKIEPNPYWNAQKERIEGIFPDADPTSVEFSVKEIGPGEDKGVWYLEQLCDPVHFPHPKTSTKEDEVKWYTFFIDEFVYEYEYDPKQYSLTAEYADMPGDNYQGQEEKFSGTMDIDKWRTFANQDNRRLWLGLGNMYISKDRESIYSDALYLVTQESIQTYYGDDAEDGIGLEHTNESYRGSIGSTTDWWDLYNEATDYEETAAYDDVDGLLNMYNYVTKNQNSSYGKRVNWANVRMTDPEVKTTRLRVGSYHTKGVAERGRPNVGDVSNFTYYIPDHPDKFMMGCLARNRDLNHDDIVGANEMRWYLPTTPVYTRMMLGAVSLRSPLFNAAEYDQNSIVAGRGTHFSHYAGSDNRQLWAEELAAIGKLYEQNAHTMRCVRNLGQYMNLLPDSKQDAYKLINAAYIERKAEDGSDPRETVRIIDLAYYHPVSLRPAIQEGDYLPVHDVTSIMSYASRSFKYAYYDCNNDHIESDMVLGELKPNYLGYLDIRNDKDETDETNWTNSASVNGLCRAYYENDDRSDLGTWRVPNITELGILELLSIIDYHNRYISCTREYFIGDPDSRGRFQWYMKAGGGNDPINNMMTAATKNNGKIYLRCVKDVIE